jgi:hypothetical protein
MRRILEWRIDAVPHRFAHDALPRLPPSVPREWSGIDEAQILMRTLIRWEILLVTAMPTQIHLGVSEIS